MVLLLPLLLACTPPPDDSLERLLGGEVEPVMAELAMLPEDAPLGELGSLARQWEALGAERAQVHQVERGMMGDGVDEALAAGDLEGASGPLASALSAWPDDPRFQAQLERLEGAARTAPPAAAAVLWSRLATILEADPLRSREARRQAARAVLLSRYEAESIDLTVAELQGVRADSVGELLAMVDAQYHVPPDWTAMAVAGQERLVWMAEAPAAMERWPGLGGLATPVLPEGAGIADAAGASRLLQALLERPTGVPDEVVLAEWVAGALSSLDPWTRAVWPAEISSWEAHHAGVTVGIGLELQQGEDGLVYVLRPQLDSPAWSAPIHQGDRLEAITDERGTIAIEELPLDRRLAVALAALEGPPDSVVRLLLQPVEGGEARTVDLIRAPVQVETLRGLARTEDNAWNLFLDEAQGLAYVRLLSFRSHTEPGFDALVEPFLDGVRGVVLDLRGNPGGHVDAAVQIADRFVEDGWLVQISGRVLPETGPDVDPTTGEALAAWNQALAGHALEGVAVVVLVDEDTASAAEVLAGSLQELCGAVVVGAPTWGKGYAQALRTAEDGSFGLQLTNLVWTLPGGRRLAHGLGGGIEPAVPLRLSPAERFQAELLSRQRAALRAHADGVPLRWTETVARADLPPLSEDPGLVLGEAVLRALLLSQASAGTDEGAL